MAKKVLIADDEPNIVLSLEFLMEQFGFEVRVAGNGREALELLESFAPDLVLLDVMMPGKNGYEVCQHIKGDAVPPAHQGDPALRQGPRRRGGQGHRDGGRRLRHQALLHARPCGQGTQPA